MKITFLPVSKYGKWSVILVIINLLVLVTGSVLPWEDGFSGFEILIQNPLQAVITVSMFLMGIFVAVLTVVSIAKYKERSVLAFLAVAAGFYSIAGFIGTVINLYLMMKFTL